MQWIACAVLMGLAGATAACDRREMGEGEPPRAADSMLTRDEALGRFRESLPPVTALRDAQPSRDALVNSFIVALSGRDTMALNAMAITPAEFAYLYYPTNAQSLPPYDLEPGLMWHLLLRRSDQGIRRALALYGGRELKLLSYDCGAEVSREGANTISGPCVMQVRDELGQTRSVQLLSQVIERDGGSKILSYANKL